MISDRNDLIGKSYGQLTVTEISEKKYRGETQYECLCTCGKTITARRCNLLSGNTKSCGCTSSKRMIETRRKKKPARDLVGNTFGRLTVVKQINKKQHTNQIWLCKCKCGKLTEVAQSNLVSGHTKSCGCLSRNTTSERMSTHRESHSRLYRVWRSMKARCQNPKTEQYCNYGGRGIQVCSEWQHYEPFRNWAMANGYDPNAPFGKCTIDRIDVDGNYEPSNCRWVDMKTQARNKRRDKGTTT